MHKTALMLPILLPNLHCSQKTVVQSPLLFPPPPPREGRAGVGGAKRLHLQNVSFDLFSIFSFQHSPIFIEVLDDIRPLEFGGQPGIFVEEVMNPYTSTCEFCHACQKHVFVAPLELASLLPSTRCVRCAFLSTNRCLESGWAMA